ncbi:MAG: TIGR04282 family arsenosugar biosynthesis glycosyltransferase [Deltaproteobacteria bacterium]|nr:TIGR04282 family arsenosugar biosynthesis glycosyltransferase [Deltaproteobacteria bacterium]
MEGTNSPGRVCVFARPPRAGRVKTRLAAALGDAAALALYRAFLADTLEAAGRSGAEVVVHLAEAPPPGQAAGREEALSGLPWRLQGEGDLGARMAGAFAAEAADGVATLAIVGSDLPALRPADLRACLARAREGAAVLAPTPDGGFWCVAGPAGLPWAAVFEGVAWSSGGERVACEARLRARGVEVAAGPLLRDVDRLEDLLALWEEVRDAGPGLARHTRAAIAADPALRERFR